MNIQVKEYKTNYVVVVSKKIDSILTGKYHYKLIIVDMNDYPF